MDKICSLQHTSPSCRIIHLVTTKGIYVSDIYLILNTATEPCGHNNVDERPHWTVVPLRHINSGGNKCIHLSTASGYRQLIHILTLLYASKSHFALGQDKIKRWAQTVKITFIEARKKGLVVKYTFGLCVKSMFPCTCFNQIHVCW
jgi:hypothetical protein